VSPRFSSVRFERAGVGSHKNRAGHVFVKAVTRADDAAGAGTPANNAILSASLWTQSFKL
jgi:hypothetical protein